MCLCPAVSVYVCIVLEQTNFLCIWTTTKKVWCKNASSLFSLHVSISGMFHSLRWNLPNACTTHPPHCGSGFFFLLYCCFLFCFGVFFCYTHLLVNKTQQLCSVFWRFSAYLRDCSSIADSTACHRPHYPLKELRYTDTLTTSTVISLLLFMLRLCFSLLMLRPYDLTVVSIPGVHSFIHSFVPSPEIEESWQEIKGTVLECTQKEKDYSRDTV